MVSTQLKLRDVGGLIVIDFIDMMSFGSQKAVMRKMGEASKTDRAKVQLGRISKFGLLELSRQKLKSSIIDTNTEICPTCNGSGQIKSLVTLTISFLRILEEEAMKNKGSLSVYLPVRLATYLLNEKRDLIQGVEKRQSVSIKVVPDPDLEGSNYNIDKEGLSEKEYKQSQKGPKNFGKTNTFRSLKPLEEQKPAIDSIVPKTAPPNPQKNESNSLPNIFTKIIQTLFGKTEEKKVERSRPPNQRGRRYNRYNSYKHNKHRSYNRRRRDYSNRNSNSSNTKTSSKK